MAQPYETELSALRGMLLQAREILATTKLPEGRSERALELLGAAVKLTEDLLTVRPAAALGSRGGTRTAENMKAKDPDYFKKIAGMRKTNAGGRPKKSTPA
jgi:hypothetical protein